MQRIDTSTKFSDLFGTGKHGFRAGNKSLGQLGTQMSADWLNDVQEEICTLVEAAGLTLDVNNRGQLAQAIQGGKLSSAVAGGTANALTADLPFNLPALVAGCPIVVRAAAANTTTTPTLAVDALAAKTIVKGNNLALLAGDIAGSGHWLRLVYDQTLDKWVLLNPATGFLAATDQLLATNGYRKLPGGLIIQWMTKVESANSATEITWPITFPTACLCAVATPMTGSASGCLITAVSTTGLIVRAGSAYDGDPTMIMAVGY